VSGVRPLAQQLFSALADGQFHSGEKLAARLGVSRSAIWKAAAALRTLGLPLRAVTRRGYCLADAVAPLDAAAIRAALPRSLLPALRNGTAHWSIASTNAQLIASEPLAPGQFDFCVAEYQTAGRGRRGRSWLAPPGGAVCLSINWAFDPLPAAAGTLSLAIGVCVLRALHALGHDDARLKWPNDLLSQGGKLAGILIELRSEAGGPAQVVIGIGINLQLGAALQEQVAATGTRAASLHASGFHLTARNELVAALVRECVAGLLVFERNGFAPFAAPWRDSDALFGASVTVSGADGATQGVARGIDASGALLVETKGDLRRFRSGDVSVRSA
jgi:BirA family transcriptional regulator, biotin operon repressor / biotin---[acetyl-CoA-carboxylase] ligase